MLVKKLNRLSGLGGVFKHFPEIVSQTIQFSDVSPPTKLYEAHLRNKHLYDKKPAFEHLGVVHSFASKTKFFVPPKIHPLIRDFMKRKYPHYCNGDSLKDNEYGMTVPSARAEYNSISKYGDPSKPFSDKIALGRAQVMLADAFAAIKPQPLMELDSCVQWLEKQTSPGYPWKNLYQKKADLLASDYFIAWYRWWETAIFAGLKFAVFWKAFIKKEWKKIKSILDWSPRTILASPIEFSILGTRLFGAQNSEIARLGFNLEVPCWMGNTKFAHHWNNLAVGLNSFPNKNDADVEKFDGKARNEAFRIVKEVRMTWFQNPDYVRKAVDFYYGEVVNSLIVGWLGDLFAKRQGQPSGQLNTLADNTLIHLLYWFYYWCAVVVKKLPDLFPTWASFRQHVYLIVQGDDSVWSYSDYVKEFFLPLTVAKHFADFGVTLKVTHDAPQELKNLEFCSTGFREFKGSYFPVLKRNKMMATILYIKNDNVQANNPRVFLRRMMALRIEVFWDTELFKMIEDIIEFILNKYENELRLKPTMVMGDDQTFDQIMDLRVSHMHIHKMYFSPL